MAAKQDKIRDLLRAASDGLTMPEIKAAAGFGMTGVLSPMSKSGEIKRGKDGRYRMVPGWEPGKRKTRHPRKPERKKIRKTTGKARMDGNGANLAGLHPPAWPLAHVCIGCSVGDQKRADLRRPAMAAIAALGWGTWVSHEPALGVVDWTGWEFLRGIVSGGESGRKARPSHPDWHRADRDFCAAHEMRYCFKQWGAWAPWGELPANDRTMVARAKAHSFADGVTVERFGKKLAYRVLDGFTHDEYPA